MAYDETLAARIRELFKASSAFDELKMFGGLAFMLGGHMCCGIIKNELMLRLGEEQTGAALKDPSVRPLDFTGKVMKGMVIVSPRGFATDRALKAWVSQARDFASSLPPKKKKGRPRSGSKRAG